jgi:hypothetical protein
MPKQLHLSALVELPDDLFDAGEIIASVKVPWYAALQTLKEKGVEFKHSQEVMEVRPKPVKRVRKPRLVMTPPGEAA